MIGEQKFRHLLRPQLEELASRAPCLCSYCFQIQLITLVSDFPLGERDAYDLIDLSVNRKYWCRKLQKKLSYDKLAER